MELFVYLAKNAEQIGIIGVLIIVIGGMAWMIRHLYSAEQKCDAARLVDSEERGEIKKELGVLTGKMDAFTMMHQTNLQNLNPPSNNDPQ